MIFATLSKTVTEKTSEKMLFKFSDLSKSLEYVKIWSNLLPFSKSVKMISWSNLLPFSKSVKMIFWSNLLTRASVQNYQFGAVYSWAKNIGKHCTWSNLLSSAKLWRNDISINFTQLGKNNLWENYFGYICFPG